ncbi:MAG: hypothetical protein A2583_11170 [Bdellovibrionales bacterium RIFOXYD1_FULL_53_11]|nr:MAG: hypothetical protein A2583_11170 [Bdellovibrionales bacterium RIFOXYD1_FULL_53_11]
MPEEHGTLILGGGLAGLSLAAFLEDRCLVLEKEAVAGGLCRSYDLGGVKYDVGPHILFSKNKAVQELHAGMVPTSRLRRSNRIFYKGRFIKYPFENELSALPPGERDYCLKEFLDNPYENHAAANMLQFFLKTFGEGITRTYLQPYNEKIWKYDPSFMDLQMVGRIPKPPREDVINSAKGAATEGYTHQLYFNYPSQGGTQSLVDAYVKKPGGRSRLELSAGITAIRKTSSGWEVDAAGGCLRARRLVNCMPLHELFPLLRLDAPAAVMRALAALKWNSIHIVMLEAAKDAIGDNFALYFADESTIFHRLSKLDFLGPEYRRNDGSSTLMAEVTFRPGSYAGALSLDDVKERVVRDLDATGLCLRRDVRHVEARSFEYAYVIYDVSHRMNADTVLGWLAANGIGAAGRFAEFEYLNMDAVVERTMRLAAKMNGEANS